MFSVFFQFFSTLLEQGNKNNNNNAYNTTTINAKRERWRYLLEKEDFRFYWGHLINAIINQAATNFSSFFRAKSFDTENEFKIRLFLFFSLYVFNF